jgi:hypothetical protein
MTNVTPAPINEPVIDEDKMVTMPWVLFFNNLFFGDTGETWTPTFTNLTFTVGAPTITGRYRYISRELAFFSITITPAATGTTTSVAGSTSMDNFPLVFTNNGVVFAVAGTTAAIGAISASASKAYPASWAAVATPVTLIGLVEVR